MVCVSCLPIPLEGVSYLDFCSLLFPCKENCSAVGEEVELSVLNLPPSGLSEAFAGTPKSLVLVLTQGCSQKSTKIIFSSSFPTLVKNSIVNASPVGESARASLLPWKLYPAPIACYLFPVWVTRSWKET